MDDDSAKARAMLGGGAGRVSETGRHRMTKTEKEKMLAGELYNPGLDPQLRLDEAANKAWMARYNAMMDTPASERHALLTEHFKSVGKDAVVRPPFFCDFGYNITLGDGVFMNFNCVILDINR